MFFQNLNEIPEIAKKTHSAIFVLPKNTEVEIKNAMLLTPKEKSIITIEQVHSMIEAQKTRQSTDKIILIRPAELLSEPAANAILKTLEEPQDKTHFVLITDAISALLPTIVSRSFVYVWRGGISPIKEIKADEKTKLIAKRLLVAGPGELVELAEEITKNKTKTREHALSILATAIEMTYKSYFLTKKPVFLAKIPKLLMAYKNISRNGHIKLRLVADLI